MKEPAIIAAVVAVFVRQSLGNLDVISLYARGDTWIQEAAATLVVGDVPSPVAGDVALWSAIMTNKKDFLQGVTQNSQVSYYCTNLGRNWCTFAYNLKGLQNAENGTPVIAAPGTKIKTHYKLNNQTNLWDQKVYLNDKLMSQISTSKGHHGTIFYVSIECASGSCSPAPAHSWEDISITLNKPDQSFYHSGDWEFKATGGKMSTADGGKSWNFTTLYVPETRPH
ncbi:hypothetical protein B0H66DRAFT_598722 [Apodospora peruviana]|uniref:Uncharacterized protein n=1 Tax=Apodospora peruviana TaxID=516989 RepID=A0AAE0IVC8_9PEZI|nr:hypothetical protein B0H66DRAFT_578785 [Apodospora peruviana]KAK3331236.1 hypothetical protein B0H66DRAFT_598722 [Apodospora peruviana]